MAWATHRLSFPRLALGLAKNEGLPLQLLAESVRWADAYQGADGVHDVCGEVGRC